jgi:hypothetical protein
MFLFEQLAQRAFEFLCQRCGQVVTTVGLHKYMPEIWSGVSTCHQLKPIGLSLKMADYLEEM